MEKRDIEDVELSVSHEQSIKASREETAVPVSIKPEKPRMYSSSTSKTRFCFCCRLPSKVAKVLEILILSCAVLFSILIFLVPVAIHINRVIESNKRPQSSNSASCSNYGNQSCNMVEEISWSEVMPFNSNSTCQPVAYTGDACSTVLSTWQTCAIGSTDNDTVFVVNASTSLEENEELANILIGALMARNAIEACVSAATEFTCQSLFPLCHCTTGTTYFPSREMCLYVSTVVCQEQWNELIHFAQQSGFTIPDCYQLPLATETIGSDIANISRDVINNITCNDNFVNINGICEARCDTFESYTPEQTRLVIISQLVAAGWSLLVGIVVLVLSFIRWKIMFTFPSVFLIYMTTSASVLSVFVLVAEIDNDKLFCSSVTVNESFNNPALFCTITGAVFQYCLLNITLWWFFHVVSIFYKVMFPIFAKSLKSKEKYIHLILFIVGIIVPIPGVVLGLTVSKWKYSLTSFPSLLCTPKDSDFWYYSTMIPLNILLAAGVICFILMFWMVHKHHAGLFYYRRSSVHLSSTEIKLLFVLCYYVIFGVITLAYFGFTTADQDNFFEGLVEYFTCEAVEQRPNVTCDPIVYQRYNYPGLGATTFLLMGFITSANLVFVINWNAMVEKVSLCFRKFCHRRKYSPNKSATIEQDPYSSINHN